MQSVSSRIWTRVAVFISYDDNNYTTGTGIIQITVLLRSCNVLTFDPAQKCYSKVMHRKEVTQSNGP